MFLAVGQLRSFVERLSIGFKVHQQCASACPRVRGFYQDTQAALSDLFRRVKNGLPEGVRRIAVFMDDPLTFGTLTAQDAANAAERAGVEIVLVATARTVDWETREEREFIGRLQVMSEIKVPAELTANELDRLPAFLVKLGAAQDEVAARQIVGSLPASRSRDVLATLYWVVPDTRGVIKRAIRDEYFRLGDSAALTRVVIGEMQANSGILQKAYGLIATSEKLGTPVPIEVLVASLGVRYDEWLDATGSDSAAFGLFYADFYNEGETVTYRTRNAVVNDIIVRTLNGGDLSHAGEFVALNTLLAGCTGSTLRQRPSRSIQGSARDSIAPANCSPESAVERTSRVSAKSARLAGLTLGGRARAGATLAIAREKTRQNRSKRFVTLM